METCSENDENPKVAQHINKENIKPKFSAIKVVDIEETTWGKETSMRHMAFYV